MIGSNMGGARCDAYWQLVCLVFIRNDNEKEQLLVGWEGSPGKMHLKNTAPVQICSVSQAIGFCWGIGCF